MGPPRAHGEHVRCLDEFRRDRLDLARHVRALGPISSLDPARLLHRTWGGGLGLLRRRGLHSRHARCRRDGLRVYADRGYESGRRLLDRLGGAPPPGPRGGGGGGLPPHPATPPAHRPVVGDVNITSGTTSYVASGTIETNDLVPGDLQAWGTLTVVDAPNRPRVSDED